MPVVRNFITRLCSRFPSSLTNWIMSQTFTTLYGPLWAHKKREIQTVDDKCSSINVVFPSKERKKKMARRESCLSSSQGSFPKRRSWDQKLVLKNKQKHWISCTILNKNIFFFISGIGLFRFRFEELEGHEHRYLVHRPNPPQRGRLSLDPHAGRE